MKILVTCFTCVAMLCLGTTASAGEDAYWSADQAGGTADYNTGGSWIGDSGAAHGAPASTDSIVVNPFGRDGTTANTVWPEVALGDTADAGLFFPNSDDSQDYSSPSNTLLTVKGTLNLSGNAIVNLAGNGAIPALQIANVQSTLTIDGGTFNGLDMNVQKGIFDVNVINGGSFNLTGDFRPITSGTFGSKGQMIIDATSSVSFNRYRLFPGGGHLYKTDIQGNANAGGSGSLLITQDSQAGTWNGGWLQDLLINGDITSNGNVGLAGFKLTLGTDGNGSPNVLIEAVPEPASLALIGFGLLGMVCTRRRRS